MLIMNIKEKNITIVKGEIVDGFLDKSMLGRDAAGLIKQIYNSYERLLLKYKESHFFYFK